MHIVSIGDNLHEMSNPVFWGKKYKSISKCCLLKILHRVLSIKDDLEIKSFHIWIKDSKNEMSQDLGIVLVFI